MHAEVRRGGRGRRERERRVTWPGDGVTLTLSARFADCPRGYACLWQDGNGTSRRVQFFHYRSYKLSAYGMPPGKRRGASSYFNNQTGGAGAYLRGTRGDSDWTFHLVGRGNLYAFNDRAGSITLTKSRWP